MKSKKTVIFLVIAISVFSLFATLFGLISSYGSGELEFTSLYGETIKLYGKGIYQHDSISAVAQGKAQDIVTLFLGIPLLLFSLYLAVKGSLQGKLLLTGTVAYFLYTYVSYVFLWTFNPLFLVYVLLMSASFFALLLLIMSFDVNELGSNFNDKLPVKIIGGFQIVFAIMIALLWLGRIIPATIKNTNPEGLEHYTTLVIQAMDLGFIVPISIISGLLILKRKPFGYLLSSIIIIKGITMCTAITAMIISLLFAGINVSLFEVFLFPILNVITIYCLVLILKNINEKVELAVKIIKTGTIKK